MIDGNPGYQGAQWNQDGRAVQRKGAAFVVFCAIARIKIGDKSRHTRPAVGKAINNRPVEGVKSVRVGNVMGADRPFLETGLPISQRDAVKVTMSRAKPGRIWLKDMRTRQCLDLFCRCTDTSASIRPEATAFG